VPVAPVGHAATGIAPLALRDAIVFRLALGGPARHDQLLATCGCDDAALRSELGLLDGDGALVRQQIAGRDLIALADAARERAADVVRAEAELLQAVVGALDAEFHVLNRRVKEILLRWQVRVDRTTEVPNDHRDARYDALVLSDLRATHAAADRLLAQLAPLRARYASLRRRLEDALARAAAGERSAVAGVTGDSFHTAWWELHGDLLAMLGRVRGADDV